MVACILDTLQCDSIPAEVFFLSFFFFLGNRDAFNRYGSPILDIKWQRTLNSEHPKLISTDKHIVRIWDPETVSFIYL